MHDEWSLPLELPSWQVAVNLKLLIHIAHNEVYQIVMCPEVSASVKHGAAAVKLVVGSVPVATQLALVY